MPRFMALLVHGTNCIFGTGSLDLNTNETIVKAGQVFTIVSMQFSIRTLGNIRDTETNLQYLPVGGGMLRLN